MNAKKLISGWVPDLPDKRDDKFEFRPQVTRLPEAIIPSVLPKRFDQGQLGSCTGNAAAACVEELHGPKCQTLSRLFAYYNARSFEGTVKQDAGASVRNAVKGIVKYGIPTERSWPYDISKFSKKAPAAIYSAALARKITSYHRVTSLADAKAAVASGVPVIFGFSVYDSFEGSDIAATGNMPMPDLSTEKMIGGHCVWMAGYDDKRPYFDSKNNQIGVGCGIIVNSWGKSWGDKGLFYMPYPYLSDRSLSDDFWAMVK